MHLLLIIKKKKKEIWYWFVSLHLVVLSMNITPLALCSCWHYLPTRRGWWAYFRKLGTEIRTRGPRLSGYRSLRRNAEIRACVEGGERIRRSCACFPRIAPADFRWRESASRLCASLFITRCGRFRSRANPFFPVIAMRLNSTPWTARISISVYFAASANRWLRHITPLLNENIPFDAYVFF